MLVLDRAQRQILAETFRDIANVAAGAMLFGQFLSGQQFSTSVAMLGGALWILLTGHAVILVKGGE